MNKQLQERHALLIQEFNQYLFDHPEFLEQIPQRAVIVLQLKGDEAYNRWSRRVARKIGRKISLLPSSKSRSLPQPALIWSVLNFVSRRWFDCFLDWYQHSTEQTGQRWKFARVNQATFQARRLGTLAEAARPELRR